MCDLNRGGVAAGSEDSGAEPQLYVAGGADEAHADQERRYYYTTYTGWFNAGMRVRWKRALGRPGPVPAPNNIQVITIYQFVGLFYDVIVL